MLKLRTATAEHIPGIFAIAKAMSKETRTYADFDFDNDKALRFIVDHVDHPHRLMVVAENDAGEVVGAFLATATETYFGRDIVTQDDAFYVLPEHRGKGTLAQFLMAYHQWAQTLNPKYIYLGVTLGINDERTIEALKVAGYETFGSLLRRTG